jgi:hypothetical protein
MMGDLDWELSLKLKTFRYLYIQMKNGKMTNSYYLRAKQIGKVFTDEIPVRIFKA